MRRGKNRRATSFCFRLYLSTVRFKGSLACEIRNTTISLMLCSLLGCWRTVHVMCLQSWLFVGFYVSHSLVHVWWHMFRGMTVKTLVISTQIICLGFFPSSWSLEYGPCSSVVMHRCRHGPNAFSNRAKWHFSWDGFKISSLNILICYCCMLMMWACVCGGQLTTVESVLPPLLVFKDWTYLPRLAWQVPLHTKPSY